MAVQRVTYLVDDLTKESGDDIVGVDFAFKGVPYHIDLGPTNLKAFEDALAPYIEAGERLSARSTSNHRPVSRRPITATDREQNQAIRDWANSQGMKVSERGRIPANVLEAFHRAH